MKKDKDHLHQLHIEIEKDLFNELKDILPTKGLVTDLMKRFIKYYVTAYKNLSAQVQNGGPMASATKKIIKEDLERG